jgi:hypothetical protein
MQKNILSCAALLLLMGNALAQAPVEPAAEPAAAPPEPEATAPANESLAAARAEPQPGEAGADPKELAGMSILGNQEAPKSLVIVPWKSSEIGAGIGVARALDTGIHAVDKDVFMRELRYYEIRTGGGN